MPTRTLQRITSFDVQTLYTNFLSSQPGWGGGSADDIADIVWDSTARTLTVERVMESGLVRYIAYTDNELYTALSGVPGWGGGSGAVIERVEYDAAGRRVVAYKVPEAA